MALKQATGRGRLGPVMMALRPPGALRATTQSKRPPEIDDGIQSAIAGEEAGRRCCGQGMALGAVAAKEVVDVGGRRGRLKEITIPDSVDITPIRMYSRRYDYIWSTDVY